MFFCIFFHNKIVYAYDQLNILSEVYDDNRKTYLCNCEYESKKINYKKCNFYPKVNNKNAHNYTWVKLIKLKDYLKKYPEWKKGHDLCKTKKGKKFKKAKCVKRIYKKLFKELNNDPHIYYPIIKQIAILIKDKKYRNIKNEKRKFGECNLEINKKYIEPRDEVKGDIARTFQYVSNKYVMENAFTKKQNIIFNAWSKNDPIDKWECKRSRLIENKTGIKNNELNLHCEKLK